MKWAFYKILSTKLSTKLSMDKLADYLGNVIRCSLLGGIHIHGVLVDGFHNVVGRPSTESLHLLVGVSEIVKIRCEEVAESVQTEVWHTGPILCSLQGLV